MSKPNTRKQTQKKAASASNHKSDSEEEFLSASDNTSEKNRPAKIDPNDFVRCFKIALQDPEIASNLQSCIAPALSELKEEISELKGDLNTYKEDVDGLKETIKQKDTQIKRLQIQMMDTQQKHDKDKSIVIDGLNVILPEEARPGSDPVTIEENATKEAVCSFVTHKLKIPLNQWDIDTCFRVPVQNRASPKRIIMSFLSQGKRNKILKSRKVLQENANNRVFINEDLIPSRAEVFKSARQAKKDGKLHRAWVYGGDVYIKKTQEAQPTLVKTLSGLNMYIHK